MQSSGTGISNTKQLMSTLVFDSVWQLIPSFATVMAGKVFIPSPHLLPYLQSRFNNIYHKRYFYSLIN